MSEKVNKIIIEWRLPDGYGKQDEYEIMDYDILDNYIVLKFNDAPNIYVPFTSILWWKVEDK